MAEVVARTDLTWSAYMFAFNFFALARSYRAAPSAGYAAFLLADAAAGAAVTWALLRRPAWFRARRAPLVALLRTARVLGNVGTVFWTPREELVFPLPRGAGRGLPPAVAFSAARKPLFLVLSSFGYRLPLASHAATNGFALLLFLRTNPRRCAAECAAGYGGQYAAAARWLDALARRSFVFAPALRAAPPHSCAAACCGVNAFAQVVLGFLLPTAALAALEEDARLEFLTDGLGGTPFYQRARALLGYSAALAPLAAAAVWAAVG
jgi:hypothetical protein